MQLRDVCKFIVDCPHSTAKDEGLGYPLIRTPNIGKGRLLLDNVHRVSEQVYRERTQRGTPEDGDIIFAREAPAGNAALVTNGEKVCLGQRTVLIRPNTELVNPQFLVYYLLGPEQQYKLLGNANGATVDHVNLPIIRNLPIQLPDRKIQDKIADILSTYDDLIENNKKQIKLLEEAAQRLYKEWFVDLHFPGYENTKIIDGIPEGWCYRKVGDFGTVVTGKTPSTSKSDYYGNDVPFVTIPDMQGNVFPLRTEKMLSQIGADSQQNKYLPADSVLVSCIATVGLVSIVKEVSQTNQQINAVILENKVELYFFYETMKRIKVLLDGVGSNGATITNVNKNKFSNIEVLYPGLKLALNFNSFCKPIFDQIYLLSKSGLKLQQIKYKLLERIMNRDIEV